MADTGTDFAWAWNAPLLQIVAPRGVLITSGRGTFYFCVGLLLSLLLHSKLLLYAAFGWGGTIYLMITALTFPQWWPPWAAPREPPTAQPTVEVATLTA